MAESLKDKTVKGVGWSAIDNVCQYAVTFVIGIILARILSPADYGLIGIVTIFTSICKTVIEAGFGTAIIRKVNVTDDDYNTAFFCNLFLSIVLYLALFFCAPFIADFFHCQELTLLTRISSLSMIVGAFAMVQYTKLTKAIDFRTQTKVSVISTVTSGVCGISMAYCGLGVWALVFQGLIAQCLRTLLLITFNRWMPALRFSMSSFRALFGFGWKMMASWILNSVWGQLYNVVVGKVYSPAVLGQYTRAQGFSQLFSTNLTSVIQRVTYPVLGTIQEDRERLICAYRKIIKESMFISFILMFSLAAVAEPLIICLIGDKWIDAAKFLPLICIATVTTPIDSINLNMLQVQGRSDLFLILEIIKKIIYIAPVLLGIYYGIYPMLYSCILATVLCFFINSYFPGKLLGYTSWKQIKDIAPSFLIAVIIVICVYPLKYLPFSNWIILPVQIVVGILSFFIICTLFKPEEYIELKNIILPYICKIFKK